MVRVQDYVEVEVVVRQWQRGSGQTMAERKRN